MRCLLVNDGNVRDGGETERHAIGAQADDQVNDRQISGKYLGKYHDLANATRGIARAEEAAVSPVRL